MHGSPTTVEFTDIGDTHRSNLCEVNLQKVVVFEIWVIKFLFLGVPMGAYEEWIGIHGGLRNKIVTLFLFSLIRIHRLTLQATEH